MGLCLQQIKEFTAGVVGGYFDGDGNMQYDDNHQGIRVGSVNQQLINDMSILLSYFNMTSTIRKEYYKNQVNNRSNGDFYVLHVATKHAEEFKKNFPLVIQHKKDNLDKIIEYNKLEKHNDIEFIDMIPTDSGISQLIADISQKLEMDGNSRNYKRFMKKDAIGYSTLERIVKEFKNEIEVQSNNFTLEGEELEKAIEKETEKRMEKRAKRQQEKGYVPKPRFKKNGEPMKEIRLLGKILKTLDNEEQQELDNKIALLEQALNADVFWDEIETLETLADPKEYVYDFTVPGLQSFMVDSGLLVHNTLNTLHSGIKGDDCNKRCSLVSAEILSFTRNPKTPQMVIMIDKQHKNSRDMADKT